MSEFTEQKTFSIPAMFNPAPYIAAGGYPEIDHLVDGGEELYDHPAYSMVFAPHQDYYAGRDEQPNMPGDQEVCDYGHPAPFCFHFLHGSENYQNVPTQEALEPLASSNFTYPLSSDPRVTPFVSTTISTGDGIPVDFFAPPNAVQFSPLPTSDLPTPESEADGMFGAPEPSPPVDASQSAVVVAHDPGARIHVGPSFSYLPNIVKEEEATEPPAVPHSAANVGIRNPKKKRTKKPAAKHKERTRRRGAQHPSPRLPIRIVPPVLVTRPHLRIASQDLYWCKSAQKGWDPLSARCIDFRVDGLEGIRLTDAMNTQFNGPDERDDPMFTDDVGTSVSCRIQFEGYPDCTPRQIVTTNHRKIKSSITKEKLAFEVAKCIKVYLAELEEEEKNPYPIRFKNMFLTRIVNVSLASWQPDIWYETGPSSSS